MPVTVLSLASTRRAISLALVLCAAVGLGACAQPTSSAKLTGDGKVIGDQLKLLTDEANKNQAAEICKTLLSPALAAKFAVAGGGSCAKSVQYAIDRADYSALTVKKVAVEGNTAVATITHADGKQYDTILLARNKSTATTPAGSTPGTTVDDWRITSFPPRAQAPASTPTTTPKAS